MLRPATRADMRRVWEWRNDPVTRAMFFDTRWIPWREHRAWFERALADPNRLLFILESPDGPAAMVRVDVEGVNGTVSINVCPGLRRRGYAREALRLLEERASAKGIAVLIARVKHTNLASVALFEELGYVRQAETDHILMTKHLGGAVAHDALCGNK